MISINQSIKRARSVLNPAQIEQRFKQMSAGRPFPGQPSLLNLLEAYDTRGGLGVIYSRKLKRVTLQRWLVSLIVYFPEKVSFLDLLLLFDNMLWLQEKSEKDPQFQQKFGLTLEVLAKFLKEMRINQGISSKQLHRLSKRMAQELKDFLIPTRHFEQVHQHILGFVQIVVNKSPGVPNRSIPPIGYIGKGYRDKGTARKPWLDGSPTWQEVASAPLSQLRSD